MSQNIPVKETAKSSEDSCSPEEFDQLISEAEALALYIARHGDSLPDNRNELREELFKAVVEAKPNHSSEKWQALMSAYSKVTAITYKNRGINGRTILDTQKKNQRTLQSCFSPRNRSMAIGVTFFILALILEVLMRWKVSISDPGELGDIKALAYLLIGTLSNFLIPAFWGGIGACIFLTKRISDKLFEMSYEESRLRGDITRIFLGSMLGVVVVSLFFPNLKEQITIGSVNLLPATLAFVTGLGVKPIYAAFESLSEELARRFRGTKNSDGSDK